VAITGVPQTTHGEGARVSLQCTDRAQCHECPAEERRRSCLAADAPTHVRIDRRTCKHLYVYIIKHFDISIYKCQDVLSSRDSDAARAVLSDNG
jgi:hypothetical protein